MRNKLTILTALFCLICTNIVFANDRLCIALTNYGDFPVEFDSLASPGIVYTVNPNSSATLSGDHMVGACLRGENDCAVHVLILDGTYNHYETIEHLPRGTRIIYKSLRQFYVDKNANVKCDS